MRALRLADLFCGAGGFTQGARLAAQDVGRQLRFDAVVNHWGVAVDSHRANHPEAAHYCRDVTRVRAEELVPGGRLDLLLASPECTDHSRAKGGKPVGDQSRETAWAVVDWCSRLYVRAILIENVPEFSNWGPIGADRKPLRSRRGELFSAWTRALEAIGYRLDWRVLRAADYGDATTRERFFLIGRRDRGAIRWPAASHSPTGSPDLFGAGAAPWRSAREVIDWALRGRSVFRRKHPLSRKTLLRVLAGAARFGWPAFLCAALRRYVQLVHGGEVPGAAAPAAARPSPFVVRSNMHRSNAECTRSLEAPLATATTDGGLALAEPFLFGNRSGNAPRLPERPLPGPTTSSSGIAFVLPQFSHGRPRAAGEEPLPSLTTTSRGVGLAEPFLGVLRQNADARSLDEPLPTVTAGGQHAALVQPFVLSQASGGAPRSTGAPLPTVTGDGAHALVLPCNSRSQARPAEAGPLPAPTARDRLGLVVPVTHADPSARARSLDAPLPTVTGAHRGELAFLTAAFGERPGQPPRVHSLDQPAPTVCAQGSLRLAEAVGGPPWPARLAEAGSVAELVELLDEAGADVLFRMLQPAELARAMGFPEGYCLTGTKEDQVRQIGNAVPVATARALVRAILEEM